MRKTAASRHNQPLLFSGGLPREQAQMDARNREKANRQGLLARAVNRSFPPSLEGVSFVQPIFLSPSQAQCGGHTDDSLSELLVQGTQVELIPRAGEGNPTAGRGPQHGDTCHQSFRPLMPSYDGWEAQLRGNEFCVLTYLIKTLNPFTWT